MKKKEKKLVNIKGREEEKQNVCGNGCERYNGSERGGKKGKKLSEPRGERISGRGFYRRTDFGGEGPSFQHEERG